MSAPRVASRAVRRGVAVDAAGAARSPSTAMLVLGGTSALVAVQGLRMALAEPSAAAEMSFIDEIKVSGVARVWRGGGLSRPSPGQV